MSETQSQQPDELLEELLSDFLDESSQLLECLNGHLLELDSVVQSRAGQPSDVDPQRLNEMFRAAHSIKGLSAMLGLSQINHLTHKMENVLDAAREGRLKFGAESLETLLVAHDLLSQQIDSLRSSADEIPTNEEVLLRIVRLLEAADEAAEAAKDSQAEGPPVPQPPPPAAALKPIPGSLPVEFDFGNIQDDDGVPSKYLAIFIDEAEMSLDMLSETLLSLEVQGGSDAHESLLVLAHRIKGSAASIGLHRGSRLAHSMEDILQELREGGRIFTSELNDALLKCVDALRLYVGTLRSGAGDISLFPGAALELLQAKATTWAGDSPSSPQTAEGHQPSGQNQEQSPEQLLASVHARAPSVGSGYATLVRFRANLPVAGLKAELALGKIGRHGELFFVYPEQEILADQDSLSWMVLGVSTHLDQQQMQDLLRIEGVEKIELQPLKPVIMPVSEPAPPTSQAVAPSVPQAAAAKTPDEPAEKNKSAEDRNSKPAETLRVDIERLDQLMNLAGQLVINKSRFYRLAEGLRHVSATQRAPQLNATWGAVKKLREMTEGRSGDSSNFDFEALASQVRKIQAGLEQVQSQIDHWGQLRKVASDLSEAVHQLDRVTDGIQRTVMDTRMVPIGPLFGRFRRVVRDMTRQTGKDIKLEILGEKTELDKRMIDELGDPLIHMVRNSADHGLEPPEERQAAGKPRQGTILLNAYHRGNSIIIEVKDDGRGLNLEKIKGKAVQRGLVSQADLDRLTPQQIYQLIWEPGFSTAEKVTEISGRGMGMDIVRTKIEDLSGTVEVNSEPGQGTSFTIRLPLTLAILPSLLAEIEGDIFAMPVESVIEIVKVTPQELFQIHGRYTARVRNRIVGIVELSELLSWSSAVERPAQPASPDKTLVILGDRGHEIGLVVNRLLGEEDVVIKSMAENYRQVPGISGASILGDGHVSLILDVAALVDMSARSQTAVPV